MPQHNAAFALARPSALNTLGAARTVPWQSPCSRLVPQFMNGDRAEQRHEAVGYTFAGYEPPPTGHVASRPISTPAAAALSPDDVVRNPARGTAHQLTALRLVAESIFTIVERAARTIFSDDTEHLLASPVELWAALYMLAIDMPESIVAQDCIPDYPSTACFARLQQLQQLLQQECVPEAVRLLREFDLQQFFTLIGAHLPPVEHRAPDFSASLAAANHLIDGAAAMQEDIDAWLPFAMQAKQKTGVELEFHGAETAPTFGGGTVIDRDEVYRAIAAKMPDAELVKGHRLCTIPSDGGCFVGLYEFFRIDDHKFRLDRIRGTGAVLVYVTDDTTGRSRVYESSADSVFAARDEAYRFLAAPEFADTTPDVIAGLAAAGVSVDYRTRHMIMFKTDDGDLAKFWLEFSPDLTSVTAHGEGVHFAQQRYTASLTMPLQRGAEGFAAAFQEAVDALRTRAVAKLISIKRDGTITGIRFPDGGGFTVFSEYHPLFELISNILFSRPEDFARVRTAVEGLAAMHWLGTTPEIVVGNHIHAETPMVVDGRLSVGPALATIRAFEERYAAIAAVLDPQKNRRKFIQPLGQRDPDFPQLACLPDYVSHADDAIQILCVVADFVTRTAKKFSALNFDNYFSELIRLLVASGKLKDVHSEQEISWHGRHYRFAPHADGVTVTFDGKSYELARIPRSSQKPTAEMRLPNVTMTRDADGRLVIDADAIEWYLKWWTAFAYRYGAAPTMSSTTTA